MKILIVYNTVEYIWYRRFFINALLSRGHNIVALGPYDGWEKRVSELGIRCVNVRLWPSGLNAFQDLVTLYDLFRVMRNEKPDVVFLYTIKPIVYGSIVARLLGVPRIFSVYVGGRDDLLSRVLYWCSLRFNEKVIFQNSEHLDSFVKHEIVSSKRVMRVPGSGVDTDMFAPRPDAAQSGHFLLVSRMLWDKGIAQYVAAARRLKSRYPDAVFALLGPRGDNPSSIPQEILDEWNAEGNIRYYGATADVRPYLANCSVYVLPSYYREGVPRTNLEALAMGKAIVTTDMPGCRETVISGVNGFVVPPRDEEALVEAMEAFLNDPGLARKMGEASRQLALDRFRIEKVNQAIINVMEKREGYTGRAVDLHHHHPIEPS
jgi:glycosyltransferase involved in cell wall biosynthesis